MTKDKRLLNLRAPFGKGNKFGKGRPKGSVTMSTLLKKAMESQLVLKTKSGSKESRTTAEWIIDSLIKKAINSKDVAAIREIFDRIDGKPSQSVEVANKDDQAFKTEISHKLDKETMKTMKKMAAAFLEESDE